MQVTKQISFIFISLFTITFIISCSSMGTTASTQKTNNTINGLLHDELVLLIEVESDSVKKYSSPKLTIDDWEFDIEPLFPPELLSEITDANGYKAETTWFVASTSIKNTNKEQSHPWDLAHDFLKKAYNTGHYEIKHIEPDIPNNWYFHDLRENKNDDVPGCETLKPITYWPYKQEFAWHLDKEYSQLREAREFVAARPHDMIRIAHIDTGYDPNHITFPQNRIQKDLQRNFYLKDNPDPYNASDPGTMGPFHVYGHGTGTLALLAGGYINWPSQYGFPDFNDFLGANNIAEVVPVRVADSVVLFYSRHLAQGILYAIAPRNNSNNKCDVISLSMGGVASKTWAYAVNLAYEAGVAIFAASGDRFGKSPPATTVYPARFNRVVSVCGVTQKYKPYYKKYNLTKCQESFGPDSKMDTTISTFAPNIPWALLGCETICNLNGEGTSVSTPQAAGAAALWLQLHGKNYQAWQKVEAVRYALFKSAQKKIKFKSDDYIFHYFGNGILKAKDALDDKYVPRIEDLQKQDPDHVKHPLFTLLFEYFKDLLGLVDSNGLLDIQKSLYEHEVLQLHYSHPHIYKIINDHLSDLENISHKMQKKFIKTLIDSPKTSNTLKQVLLKIYDTLLIQKIE